MDSFLSTTALVAELRSRRISAVEALEQAIGRIDARDGDLNAVVVRDFERARAAAVAADVALAKGDQRPLLGVPMTVKESFNVAGLPTTWGMPGVDATRSLHDSVTVSRLKASGAVIIGKTNVATYLGDWQSVNAVYGRTRNPWDLGRTPGGSSGGAAAALAAGFVSLELGSDLFGSLRVPAHCCGVFAHRSSHGLVPARGHAPPGTPELSVGLDSELGVVGPLARCAGDLTLALDVLAGPDDAQATAYRLALPAARHAYLKDFRVLVLESHPLLPLSSEVGAAIQRFASNLRSAGATVADGSPLLPDLSHLAETFNWQLMALLGADYPDEVYASRWERATRLPAQDQSREATQARALRLESSRLVSRTASARRHRASMATIVSRVGRRDLSGTAHPAFRTTMRKWISGPSRSTAGGFRYGLQAVWAGPASLSGLPSTAMPIGLGSSGMPIGVQVMGPYLEDRTTLGFAQLAEREFGGYRAPPGFT